MQKKHNRKCIPKIPSHARLEQEVLTFVLRTGRMWAGLMTIFYLNKVNNLKVKVLGFIQTVSLCPQTSVNIVRAALPDSRQDLYNSEILPSFCTAVAPDGQMYY